MMRDRISTYALLVVSSLLACNGCSSVTGDGSEDAEGDSFLGPDGKADGAIDDGSAEATGVLRVANELSVDALRYDVHLYSNAARNMVAHRQGPDATDGTDDDDPFDTLRELDDVRYVGPRSFDRLLEYARDNGYISDDTRGVCESEHDGVTSDGEPVVICETPFADRPFVRPPPDRLDANAELYVAVDPLAAADNVLVARDGTAYRMVDDAGDEVSLDAFDGFRWPSYRFLYTIYRVRGQLVDASSIRVEDVAPAIVLTGTAIDGELLGSWEGTASRHVADGRFDPAQRVPLRITFSRLERAERQLPVWSDLSELLPDGDVWVAVGAIDNWSTPVESATGECLASLASLGDESPYTGATSGEVRLYRFPAMHLPGDYQLVFDYPEGSVDLASNGMGWIGPAHAAALIQDEARETWTEWFSYHHGTPNGNSIEDMTRVTDGGDGC